MKTGLKIAVSVVLTVIAISVTIWTRFSSPALTETQLLVHFWPHYIVSIVLLGLSYLILNGTGRG